MKDDDYTADTGTATASDDRPGEALVARAARILSDGPQVRDYLKVPPEVVARVNQQAAGAEMSSEEWQWVIDNYTLQAHCTGRRAACWRTGKGVIAFAVGDDDVRAFLAWFHRVPEERRPNVIIEYP